MSLEAGTTPIVAIQSISLDHSANQLRWEEICCPHGLVQHFRSWRRQLVSPSVLGLHQGGRRRLTHCRAGQFTRIEGGQWVGFVPGLRNGDLYLFHVVGRVGGTERPKGDPFAQDLTHESMWPDRQCELNNA